MCACESEYVCACVCVCVIILLYFRPPQVTVFTERIIAHKNTIQIHHLEKS